EGKRREAEDQRKSPSHHRALPSAAGAVRTNSSAGSKNSTGGGGASRMHTAGSTRRFTIAELASPPRITAAATWSISFPGTSPITANGTSAAAATSVAATIDGARSAAARATT